MVVEPTPLKNISQIGNLPKIGVKIKIVSNHPLDPNGESVVGMENYPSSACIYPGSVQPPIKT